MKYSLIGTGGQRNPENNGWPSLFHILSDNFQVWKYEKYQDILSRKYTWQNLLSRLNKWARTRSYIRSLSCRITIAAFPVGIFIWTIDVLGLGVWDSSQFAVRKKQLVWKYCKLPPCRNFTCPSFPQKRECGVKCAINSSQGSEELTQCYHRIFFAFFKKTRSHEILHPELKHKIDNGSNNVDIAKNNINKKILNIN